MRDEGAGSCESCVDCPKYVYKGDDEQYCMAARMREFVLQRWQKKPRWCPIEARKRRAEWQGRSYNNENRGR